jgi:hypothetical protein
VPTLQRHALPPAPRLIPQLSHPTDRMPQPARDNRAGSCLAAAWQLGFHTALHSRAPSRAESRRPQATPPSGMDPPPGAWGATGASYHRDTYSTPSPPHPRGKWTDPANVQPRARLFSPPPVARCQRQLALEAPGHARVPFSGLRRITSPATAYPRHRWPAVGLHIGLLPIYAYSIARREQGRAGQGRVPGRAGQGRAGQGMAWLRLAP